MIVMAHYEWRIDRNGELVTPVDLHDEPYDHHFLTEEEALASKRDIAPTKDWMLVHVTTKIVRDSVVDPACDTCHDEGDITCNYCAGSGEGQVDGSRCTSCRGRGAVPCGCQDDDDLT